MLIAFLLFLLLICNSALSLFTEPRISPSKYVNEIRRRDKKKKRRDKKRSATNYATHTPQLLFIALGLTFFYFPFISFLFRVLIIYGVNYVGDDDHDGVQDSLQVKH